MVPEMQEIDEFFDSLNPNIEVIWGISSDNTIGEDAKVTILATGMEESYQKVDDDQKDDDYYESLISQLYKPIQKPVEEPAQDPYFVVEPAPDPEPYIKEKPARHRQTLANKWMNWLKTFAQDTEE